MSFQSIHIAYRATRLRLGSATLYILIYFQRLMFDGHPNLQVWLRRSVDHWERHGNTSPIFGLGTLSRMPPIFEE